MRKVFGVLFVAVIMSGCASIGTIKMTQPLMGKLNIYRRLEIQTASSVSNSTQETVQLKTGIIEKLRDTKLFEKVFSQTDSTDAKTDLQLKATIVSLNRVNLITRILLGAMAGRATVSVEVNLLDNTSGKVISSLTADGMSSGGSIFAGRTPQAIDRAVEQIVEFVKNNM